MIILNYPHLPSSRKILLVNPNKSQALLFSLKEESYYKRNIDYALGILFYYQGMTKQSEYHLRIALKLASHKIKIKSIIEMLEKIKS